MRTSALCLLLALPAFAATDASHFRGVLTGEPQPHLQLASFDGPAETPVTRMTREQLEDESYRLNSDRPSFGGPIGLMAAGGGGMVAGLTFAILEGGPYGSAFMVGFGALLCVAGGVLITIGVIKLILNIVRRGAYDARLAEIHAQLDSMEHGAPPPPAPTGVDQMPLPPPPPLPPSGASLGGPQPAMVLASF
jgi:hypothetical protein